MKIRFISPYEVETAASIVGRNYSKLYEKYAKIEIDATFLNPVIPPNYLVAVEKDIVLGFCGYIQSWMDYGVYQIYWVNVLPEEQGKGIGSALVTAAIKKIKSVRGNSKATSILLTAKGKNVGFYNKKFGFKKLQQLDGDEYLMGLKVNKS